MECQPKLKRAVRPNGSERLKELYVEVVRFSGLDYEVQNDELRTHLITVGRMRRKTWHSNPIQNFDIDENMEIE